MENNLPNETKMTVAKMITNWSLKHAWINFHQTDWGERKNWNNGCFHFTYEYRGCGVGLGKELWQIIDAKITLLLLSLTTLYAISVTSMMEATETWLFHTLNRITNSGQIMHMMFNNLDVRPTAWPGRITKKLSKSYGLNGICSHWRMRLGWTFLAKRMSQTRKELEVDLH